MARLTDEQREARRIEREEEFGKKNKSMDNNDTNNNPENTGNSTEPEKTTVTPDQNTATTTSEQEKTTTPNVGPQKTWKPFAGDRIQRDYSTPKINPDLLNTPIPEQNINVNGPMTSEGAADLLNKPIQPNTELATKQPPPKPNPVNKDWDTMTEQEKQVSSAQTADIILGVYDKLHYFGRQLIKVDEQEVIEKHNDGKIDMYAAAMDNDEDPEKEVTIKEFWEDFNKQVDERFILTERFKNEVRPPMERLCNKYGLGASDGLFLAFKFGEDAATKVVMSVGFKKTVNHMMEHFEKNHAKFEAAVAKEVEKREKDRIKAEGPTTTATKETKTETPGEQKEEKIITEENKNEVKP